MKSRALIYSLVFVLALMSCNGSTSPTISATQTPNNVVVTDTFLPATQTPSPSITPAASLTLFVGVTFTPTVPTVTPKDVAVSCRYGPGQGWLARRHSGLAAARTAQILGKDSNETWWYIVDPNDSTIHCWVDMSLTIASGDLSGVSVVETPTASVTLTLIVEPKTISVAGCSGSIQPLKITGTITVNGPVTVEWHFATQQGGDMPNKTAEFDAYGEKSFSAEYTPPLSAGPYWIRLIVTKPIDIQAQVPYTIVCP